MTIAERQATLYEQLLRQTRAAKTAARILANQSAEAKKLALAKMAEMLLLRQADILSANAGDVAQAAERRGQQGSTKSFIDRLTLTPARLQTIAESVRTIAELADPIGETLDRWQLRNGMQMEKRCVPLGVIAMIYEARPNVTVDAAALTLKTGNAVVLRGSADALASNRAITAALREGLRAAAFPEDAVQLVEAVEHEAVDLLVRMNETVDLVIPRGGAQLIRTVVEKSTVPVIETGVGNCHVYVDAEADEQMAWDITVNAKTQRPSVCNSTETLLVHEAIASRWLPQAIERLRERGVEIHGCERTRQLVPDVVAAQESDWSTEYLDLKLAVKIVDSVQEAIEHIEHYGSHHTESIVTRNEETAARFLRQVDSAAVYHNASTRLTDGFVFGFGAEIGISTQKLHARGPMGLQALTSYKYVGHGNGQLIV